MSAKTIIIRKLSRTPKQDSSDEILFQNGVNLIVGEKDSGKTKWLSMLDFLLGDPGKPQDVFGEQLAEKYDSVSAELEVAGEQIKLERRWKEEGKTKIRVNESSYTPSEFSDFLLEKLNIPAISFPKGNPWAERAWTTLSWRMLLRHIYRQERFWTDFADKQPAGEQHACIAQFLGAAVSLFPQKWGELIQKQKELEAIQAKKDAHVALLNSITAELVQHSEMTVGVTENSLDEAEQRLKTQLAQLDQRRTTLLDEVQKEVQVKVGAQAELRRKKLNEINEDRDRANQERAKLGRREAELTSYHEVLKAELERLGRAKASGQVFADLKVTHCPACDQEVNSHSVPSGTCFLCHQSLRNGSLTTATNRLSFEEDQLTEEAGEIGELLTKLQNDIAGLDARLADLNESSARLDSELTVARRVAASLIPEDLVLIDQDAGRIKEQLEFLNRVRRTLEMQKRLAEQIDALQREEVRLKAELEATTPDVNLEEISSHFESRMLDYLNKINVGDQRRWQYGPVSFRLRSRDFQVKVRGGAWNAQIGATSQALVLFAYHYAMLSLLADGRFNYPGLVIIDFPLELADGATIADKENYLVEPFIQLCAQKGMEATQFIAAGRAFENLAGTHQIRLAR